MTLLQAKQAALNEARANLKKFLDSLKDDKGDFKAFDADGEKTLKAHEDGIASLEAEVKSVERLVAAEEKAKPVELTQAKRFGGDGEGESKEAVKASVPAIPRVSRVKSFKDDGDSRAELKAYRFGMFALATIWGNQKAIDYCAKNGLDLVKAQTEGVNTTGGFAVPDEFNNDLIDLREMYGVFRQYARIRPMSRDRMTIPRRTGGVTAYWVDEGDTITDSTATGDVVGLTAKKLAALVLASSEVFEDAAIDIGEWIAREIAWAFAQEEDDAGFNGDGTSTYGRITGVRQKLRDVDGTIANIKGLYVGTGNAYSELTLGDFEGVVGLLPQYADTPNARWFVHRTFYYQVMVREALEAGGVEMREVIGGQRTPIYLGYPVVFSQLMPKVEGNSQVCALLGDLSLAASFGDRRELSLARSLDYRFANDQVAIRGTERIDINVHDVGNTTDAGPIVGLITAAS
jgi:HK97 family phage major capsid protein